VLTVFVCGGLPIERPKVSPAVRGLNGPVRFTLSRQSAILMVSCFMLAGLLSLILGVAFGMRQNGMNGSTATTLSPALTPALIAASGQ
jgi:hypothetical protein